jgi:hypothetical protein
MNSKKDVNGISDENIEWRGYADAKPSESIQKDDLPGLAVCLIFPYMANVDVLELPVKQYKDYETKRKGKRARRLADWLDDQKSNGLVLSGFNIAETQHEAARIGLELIQELPNTRVEPHHKKFRLYFEDNYINFSHAVALGYYFIAICIGMIYPASKLEKDKRKLLLLMDRFPDCNTNETKPGETNPVTQGIKFIEFIRHNSKTALGIEENRKSKNTKINFGTLDWWKDKNESKWKKGKTHPHFVLPDWLAAASIAHNFRDEFISTFSKEKYGIDAADGLDVLYNSFKKYDLYSLSNGSMSYINAENKLWEVSKEARDFIFAHANGSN